MHLIVYIQKIKAMSKVLKIYYRFQCIKCYVCQRYTTDFNALNAMYVKDIKDGVCGFYTTYCYSFTHVEDVEGVQYYVLYSVYRAPLYSRREGYLKNISILWI